MNPSADEPRTDPSPRHAAKRLGCGGAVLIVLAALTCAAGVAYWLWTTEPAYVAENRAFLRQHTPAELESIARSLENRISRRLTAIEGGAPASGSERGSTGSAGAGSAGAGSAGAAGTGSAGVADASGGGAAAEAEEPERLSSFEALQARAREPGLRKVEMTVDELNAWIETRAPDWLANQGIEMPSQVSDPMVALEGEQLVVGFRFSEGDFSQWVSMNVDVRVDDTGRAHARLTGVRGGRLPVPARRAMEQMAERLEKRVGAEKMAQARAAMDGREFSARLKLDSRIATMTDLTTRGRKLSITVRTEAITEENAEAAEALPGL